MFHVGVTGVATYSRSRPDGCICIQSFVEGVPDCTHGRIEVVGHLIANPPLKVNLLKMSSGIEVSTFHNSLLFGVDEIYIVI